MEHLETTTEKQGQASAPQATEPKDNEQFDKERHPYRPRGLKTRLHEDGSIVDQ